MKAAQRRAGSAHACAQLVLVEHVSLGSRLTLARQIGRRSLGAELLQDFLLQTAVTLQHRMVHLRHRRRASVTKGSIISARLGFFFTFLSSIVSCSSPGQRVCVRACVPAAREAAAWRQVALRELSSRCQRRTRPIAQEHLRGRGTSSQQDCSSTAISVTRTQSEQAASLFSLLLTFTSFSFFGPCPSVYLPSFLPSFPERPC